MRAIGTTSLILGIAYWLFPLLVVEQGVFLLTAVVAAVLLIAWRSAFKVISERFTPRERLLLVGTSPAAIVLARELFERRHELGVEIVGFVDTDASRVGAPVINPGVVGTLDDIPALTARLGVNRVVVSLSDQRGKLPMDRLLDVRLRSGVLFDHLASVYEEYTGKIALENLRPSWLIFSTGFRKTRLLADHQARLRHRRRGVRLDTVAAVVRDHGAAREARFAGRSGVLSPGARWPERGDVHHSQIPDDAERCGGDAPVRCGARETAIRALRVSATFSARRASMKSRSCGTCCEAT